MAKREGAKAGEFGGQDRESRAAVSGLLGGMKIEAGIKGARLSGILEAVGAHPDTALDCLCGLKKSSAPTGEAETRRRWND